MNDSAAVVDQEVFNPFVGLRPFEEREAHLFFGRDGQSDELVARLARKRFVAVVGVSGSGKSSLVRAGLFASLRGGFMASAGSHWRIALLRPGNAPLASLAEALHGALRDPSQPDADPLPQALIEATLRRSSLGLLDAVQQARLPREENVLVVVDQFEELFRYQRLRREASIEDEAAAFVKLLLEPPQQSALPIYVMLTMRSDFLGDCAQFRGLPETMNDSQYLIPRMNRDERRQAIEGPIGVGGGRISARLVQRLLNDVGEDPDQLPVLQHALMRTWLHWELHRGERSQLDLEDYEAIGTMASALSLDADEAYREIGSTPGQQIAGKLFKRLTERGPDIRETRRPTRFDELCAVTAASAADVSAVIDRFRDPARSFLVPPFGSPLRNDSIVDISHESLIRKWKRLDAWVNDESESRVMYLRLADAAHRFRDGKAGLWRNPDLRLALDWMRRAQPNAAWSQRYGGDFADVDSFLAKSRRRWRLAKGGRVATALALIGLTAYSLIARNQAERQALRERQMTDVALATLRTLTYSVPAKLRDIPGTLDVLRDLYDQNIRLLDQMEAIAGPNQASVRELAVNSLLLGDQLLELGDARRARDAYERSLPRIRRLIESQPDNPSWQRDLAVYHQRMGNLSLAEGTFDVALREYRESLQSIERLLAQAPQSTTLQTDLSIAHEKIGNALLAQGDTAGALNEYVQDLEITQRVADPANAQSQIDLAIAHERMAAALERAGRKAEAASHAQSAQQIRGSVAERTMPQ
jgi:tetratricopeptide (TPR) repeat protein